MSTYEYAKSLMEQGVTFSLNTPTRSTQFAPGNMYYNFSSLKDHFEFFRDESDSIPQVIISTTRGTEDDYCHGNECVESVTRWLKQPAKEELT